MLRRIKALDIWMNGNRVGQWARSATGVDHLTYDAEWMAATHGRPLSLSLPFARGHAPDQPAPIRGDVVTAYFENLIPDNERILRRLQDHYHTRSTSAFDLLAAVGRDCAGAVQLLPTGHEPDDVKVIQSQPLDEQGVAQLLRDATSASPWTAEEADAFRLSIAGAQEKTALLRHKEAWCVPRGATPSTHIFKLPLGLVGNMRADMQNSVENEWLCMELARELGLPVAGVAIDRFEDQCVLIVERFDRRLAPDRTWWQRIPQEDFCQASGLPPSRKYEADGGPGIREIMRLLEGAEHAREDRDRFFMAQLVFWLLAATDGHAKNFSIHLQPGGGYRLTPLYDILSTYPIQGCAANQLDPRKAKLAMAVRSRNAHYRLHDIHRWHWVSMAEALGLKGVEDMIDEIVERVPKAIETVADRLPPNFPSAVFDSIGHGMRHAAERMSNEANKRGA